MSSGVPSPSTVVIAAPSVIGMMLGAKIGARLLTVLKASVVRRLVLALLFAALNW